MNQNSKNNYSNQHSSLIKKLNTPNVIKEIKNKVQPVSLGKNLGTTKKASLMDSSPNQETKGAQENEPSQSLETSSRAAIAGQTFDANQLYTMAKMGYTQWEYGKYDRARAIFQTLVKAKPNESWFRTALGSVYQKQKQYAEALQQYNIALQLNPMDLPSRVNRGEIFLKVGKREEGVEDLMTATQSDPSGQHPSALRAKALLKACRRQLK